MLEFILWYITITVLGLLTFPLAYRLVPALSDRGYALSRTLGLLLWAFIFWLTVSFGISQNTVGGLLLALVVVIGLAGWANWKADRASFNGAQDKPETVDGGNKPSTLNLQPIFAWLKDNLRYIASVEILFLVAFALMAFIRANNPDLTGTEKPMEMAFINAIIHSPTFPPHDPWLSGYAISYYYFGYVMTAMLAEITGTIGSVAFNLMLSLIFALSAIGAYGLVYNLLRAYWASNKNNKVESSPSTVHRLRSTAGAFLAPIFLLLLGNWEAILDVLHKRGVAWTGSPGEINFWTNLGVGYPTPDGTGPYNFWTWLNILELKDPPQPTMGGVFDRLGSWISAEGIGGIGRWFIEAFMPDRGWWWWRASRVVTDYNLVGQWDELIDEFPAFSYILGDLHPHVLAMPFGLLVGALALNLYMGGWKGMTSLFRKVKITETYEFELNFPVRLDGFLLLAVALGGMSFLNTWDFPIYLGLVIGALALMLVQERGWGWGLIEDLLKFAIPLGILSIVLYLPFYIGFSSQAGGIVPNVIFATRGAHLWVMFGGLFVPIFAFILYMRKKENPSWRMGFALTIGFVLLLWLFSTILAIIAGNTDIGRQFISAQGLSSTWEVLRDATLRRLAFGTGLLTLVLLLGGATAYLTAKKAQGSPTEGIGPRSPIPFVFMFILFGGLLVLAPDFVFIRDQFGARMNTVFKFYYEAWALWSVAAVFAISVMLSELRGWKFGAYTTVVVGLIGVGLLYPVLGFANKTNSFQPFQRTLDGAAYLPQDERDAFLFLEKAEPGVVVEAVGGQYSDFGRVSIYSGKPGVLGWPGHESQWRGSDREMGSREADVQMLYTTHNWDQALEILKQYNIRYIYVGPQERQKYNVYEDKFAKNLSSIYNQGQVVIYIVP